MKEALKKELAIHQKLHSENIVRYSERYLDSSRPYKPIITIIWFKNTAERAT